MSRKSELLDVAVKLAVDKTCQRLGIHGACPIAQALVEMAVKRAREPSDDGEPRPRVPAGDREARVQRPEEKRDRFTELTPEERVFSFPDVLSMPSTTGVALIVRSAILRSMAAHATAAGGAGSIQGAKGFPKSAGGRVVQSIVHRITEGAGTRKDRTGSGDPSFFITEGT